MERELEYEAEYEVGRNIPDSLERGTVFLLLIFFHPFSLHYFLFFFLNRAWCSRGMTCDMVRDMVIYIM